MDKYTPIVILFGPPASGKSMMSNRLILFLRKYNYYMINHIRPLNYHEYEVVDKYGRTICCISDLIGQWCFDPSNPMLHQLCLPITNLLSLPNPRTWIFVQELNDIWQDITIRNAYVGKIHQLSTLLNYKDKVIFVCSKIDKHKELLLPNRRPNDRAILHELDKQYNGIFADFENQNPIVRLIKRYNFAFVPFSSGIFSQNPYGKEIYIPSEEFYPQQLWSSIIQCIK